MPRLTKLYTRTGDDGSTALGSGQRVAKNSLRVAAYGTVDELNSAVGVALACGLATRLAEILPNIQNELFHLGADLSYLEADKVKRPIPHIENRHIDQLELWIDEFNAALGPLKNFILPGGRLGAAHLQLARAICRRAERETQTLAQAEPISTHALPYLNRLSDLLFVMARYENHQRGMAEVLWDTRA